MQPFLLVFILLCGISYIRAALLPNHQKRLLPNLGIHGGAEATSHQYPPAVWMQVFTKNARNKTVPHQCGGTLISKDYVLTAAHCLVTTLVKRKHDIVLGVHDWDTDDPNDHQAFKVTKANFIIHPSYNHTSTAGVADIGLIKLSSSAKIKASEIEIAKLPSLADAWNPYLNERVKVYGWGPLTENGNVSDILRYYESKIITSVNCRRVITVNADNFCTSGKDVGNKNAAICGGDSGGPLVKSNDGQLLGIVSRGHNCASGGPSVFVNVSTYLNWIKVNSNAVIN